MLTRSAVLDLGVVFAALLVGMSLESERVQSRAIPSFQPQDNLVIRQLVTTPNEIAAQTQPLVATLADGNYQLCSQPDPHSWRDGAGDTMAILTQITLFVSKVTLMTI